ncbi:MAG: ABC transporter permease [Candidatus Rokubacteria bacterium]|nr:ABC transporter permease [Candidatus Rokubacteria bacterium]
MALSIPLSLLVLWEVFSQTSILSPRYFPPPTLVAATLTRLLAGGDLWGETLVTLNRLAIAFVLAAAPGVPAGLAMGLFRPVRYAIEPYLALLYPLPKIALLPLLLIVLGVGEKAFILTGAISAFFQIVISTLGGVQTMDPRLLEVGRNYGARGIALFRKVILPATLPAILTGLRLGLGLALIAVIAVEFVTAKSGLGHLVFRYWQMLLTAEMFAAFVLVGLIGLAFTRGLRALQRRTLAWKEEIGWQ